MMRLLFVLVLMVSACCKPAASPTEVPSDFKIILGRQGTFAGRSMGYSIDAGGRVVRWEGKYPEETRQATARLDRKDVKRLWRRSEDIDFLKMSDQAMATTGAFIAVTSGGQSRRVTWTERDDGALTPAQRFFDECLDAAQSALGE